MCKEGWCVGLGQEEVVRGWGELLKGGGTGEEKKDFKKERQAGSRGGCLKKGGLEPPYKL